MGTYHLAAASVWLGLTAFASLPASAGPLIGSPHLGKDMEPLVHLAQRRDGDRADRPDRGDRGDRQERRERADRREDFERRDRFRQPDRDRRDTRIIVRPVPNVRFVIGPTRVVCRVIRERRFNPRTGVVRIRPVRECSRFVGRRRVIVSRRVIG